MMRKHHCFVLLTFVILLTLASSGSGSVICIVTPSPPAAAVAPHHNVGDESDFSITQQKQHREREEQYSRATENTRAFTTLQAALNECPQDTSTGTIRIEISPHHHHQASGLVFYGRGIQPLYHIVSHTDGESLQLATLVNAYRWSAQNNVSAIVLERLYLEGAATEAALFQPSLAYTSVIVKECTVQNYNGPRVLDLDAADEGVALEVSYTTFRNILGAALHARHLEQYLVRHAEFERCGGVKSPVCVFLSQGFASRSTSEFYRNQHHSAAKSEAASDPDASCAFHLDNVHWNTPQPVVAGNSVLEPALLDVGMRFTRFRGVSVYETLPGEHFTNQLALQHLAALQQDVHGTVNAYEWLPDNGNPSADASCAAQDEEMCATLGQHRVTTSSCVVRDAEALQSALASCASKDIVLLGGEGISIYAVDGLRFFRSNLLLVSHDGAIVFGAGHTVEAHTSNVVIRGVTFIQPPDTREPILTVQEGSDVTLENNRFVGSGLSTAGAVRAESGAEGVYAYYNSFSEFYFRSIELLQPLAYHFQQNLFSDTIGTALRIEKLGPSAGGVVRDNAFHNCRGVAQRGGTTNIVSVGGASRDSAFVEFERNVLTMEEAYTHMDDVGMRFKDVHVRTLRSNVCYGTNVGVVFQNVTFGETVSANELVHGLISDTVYIDQDVTVPNAARLLHQHARSSDEDACVVNQNYAPHLQDAFHYANVTSALLYCPKTLSTVHLSASEGSNVHHYPNKVDVYGERTIVGERGVSLRVPGVLLHHDARFNVANLELRPSSSNSSLIGYVRTARDEEALSVSFQNVEFVSNWIVDVHMQRDSASFLMQGCNMYGSGGSDGRVVVHFPRKRHATAVPSSVTFENNTFHAVSGTPIRVDDVDEWRVVANTFNDCGSFDAQSTGAIQLRADDTVSTSVPRHFVFENNTVVVVVSSSRQTSTLVEGGGERNTFGRLLVKSMKSAFWITGPYKKEDTLQAWTFRNNAVRVESGADDMRFPVGVRFSGQPSSVLQMALPHDWVSVHGSTVLSNLAAQDNCGVSGTEHDMLWTTGAYMLDSFITPSEYDVCSDTPGVLGTNTSSCKCSAPPPAHCVVDAHDATFVPGKNPYYDKWLFRTMREALEHCIDPERAIEVRSVQHNTLDGASIAMAHSDWYLFTRNGVRIHAGAEHVIGANNITLDGFTFPPYTTIRNSRIRQDLKDVVIQNCTFEDVSVRSSISGVWQSITVRNCSFRARQRLSQEDEFAVVRVQVSDSVRVQDCSFEGFDRTALRIDGAPQNSTVVSRNHFALRVDREHADTVWSVPRGGVYVSASNSALSYLEFDRNVFTGLVPCTANDSALLDSVVGMIETGGSVGLYAAFWIESAPTTALITRNQVEGCVPVGMRLTHAVSMEGKTASEQQSFLSSVVMSASNLAVSGVWHDIVASMPEQDQLLQAVPFQNRGYICDMGCTTEETIFLASLLAFVVVLSITVCCILGCGSQEDTIRWYYSDFLHARIPVDRKWWPVLLQTFLPWLDPKQGPRPAPAWLYDNVIRDTALERERQAHIDPTARQRNAKELLEAERRYGAASSLPPSLVEANQNKAIRVLGSGKPVCYKDINLV